MGQQPLSDAQLLAASEALTTTHGNIVQAAAILGIPKPTFENHVRAAVRRGFVDLEALRASKPKLLRESKPSPRLPVTADECWALLDGWIGRKRIPKAKPPKWKAGAVQRICVAGDFHAPFTDMNAVASLITEEGPKTDTLVIAGDFMDMHGASTFVKYETVTLEQEIAHADATLDQLARAFPDILVVDGSNHHDRFEKRLRAMLPPDVMHGVEVLCGGNLSLMKLLAKRHRNVRFAPVTSGRYEVGWCSQIGDVLVTHAEKFSKVPSAALRGIDEWLTDQQDILNLQPWRVLIQAHTHQLGCFPFKADRMLVESGCMCETMGYQLTARVMGRPQRQGWITLTQHHGRTDMNSIRMRWLNADRQVA
jgi:hypothetical protein